MEATAIRRMDSEPLPAEKERSGYGPLSASLCPAAEALDRLSGEWQALAQDASEANAFAELWFVRAGMRYLAAGEDIRLLEVRDGGRLIGLFPLVIAGRYGRLPVRHVGNWLHYHSFLGTPLIRKGAEPAFWAAALAALDAEPWARGFLHIKGLVEHGPVHDALIAAARLAGRPCDTVLRSERALLQSDLSPQAYYEQTVRKKKRKELKRLRSRLDELGSVTVRHLTGAAEVEPWCDDFLALERLGWKGRQGSALVCTAATEAFFRKVVTGAFEAGKLDFLRLDLDGRPIAMLVNFLTPPGSFSFKIAFDEEHARFSPGVLLQIENLQLLDNPAIAWMDSCAIEDHSMINSLWGERRAIVRVTVPLAGLRRGMLFQLCRAIEDSYAALKRLAAPSKAAARHQDNDD